MSCEAYSTVPGCAEMCYIFSSLVYTAKGSEKKYLKHQEVESKGLQSVGRRGVVYFFFVRLRGKKKKSQIYQRHYNDPGAERVCPFPSG